MSVIYADPNTGNAYEGDNPPVNFTQQFNSAVEYETWRDANFASSPAPAVPIRIPPVSKRKILLELNEATPRITYEMIESLIPILIPEGPQREAAFIELINSIEWERDHTLVPILKGYFNVSDEWVGNIWRRADERR
jgi:hypothetical protein